MLGTIALEFGDAPQSSWEKKNNTTHLTDFYITKDLIVCDNTETK